MSIFDLNRATLIGNVTRDPELKYTAKGTAVMNFSIATNRSLQGEDGQYKELPTFHNVVAWSKTAERLAKVLFKGMKVYVEGRIENRSYDKDGVTRYISEIVVDNAIVFDRAGRQTPVGGSAPEATAAKPAAKKAAKKEEPVDEPGGSFPDGEFEDVDPNDIPF